MSIARSIIGFGVLAGTEATYNAGASLSPSDDGLQGIEPPTMDIMYAYDGDRPVPPATYGRQPYAEPVGETAEGTIAVELRGAGAAYTTGSVPPIHAMIQACGFDAALGSGAWTYTPTPVGDDYSSAALRLYTRTERYDVTGVLSNLEIVVEEGAPARAVFNYMGLPGVPTNEALPAITYNHILPPKCSDIGFQWGSHTDLVVRGMSLALNRELTPRMNLNAVQGSAGFAAGSRGPVLTVSLETSALATFSPYADIRNKTARTFEMTVGSVAANRFEIGGRGQIISVTKSEDGPVALWDLEIALVNTNSVSNDDLYITFG